MTISDPDLAPDLSGLSGEEIIALGERIIAFGRVILRLEGKPAGQVGGQVSGNGNGNGHGNSNGHKTQAERVVEEVLAPLGPKPKVTRPKEDHTISQVGDIVTYDKAIAAAKELRVFSQRKFAETLSLENAKALYWLKRFRDEGMVEYYGAKYHCLVNFEFRDWMIRQQTAFSPEQAAEGTGLSQMDAMEEIERWEAKRVLRQVEDGQFEYVPPDGSGPREHETKCPPEKLPPSYDLAPVRGMPIRIVNDSRQTRSTPGSGHRVRQRNKRYETMQEVKAERAEARKAKGQQNANWKSRSNKRTKAA